MSFVRNVRLPMRRAGKGTLYLCVCPKTRGFLLIFGFCFCVRSLSSQDTHTHTHKLSQTVATRMVAHSFFSPPPSRLPEALSGRLLVDPLGFLLAFEIISLFPAVAGLGTSAERHIERERA